MNDQRIYFQERDLTGVPEFFPRAVFYGDGVFETMRWKGSAPVFLNRHIDRISRAASAVGIAPPSPENITREINNAVRKSGFSDCAVKVCVISDAPPSPFFAPPDGSHTIISVRQIKNGAENSSVKLLLSDIWRTRPDSPLSAVKSLNYLENVIAMREAAKKGFDDALLCSPDGNIAETTCRNIFWGSGRDLFTPPEDCGILPGITRGVLMEKAADAGFSVAEPHVKPSTAANAEFAFVTNSVSGINPVEKMQYQGLTREFSTATHPSYVEIKTLLFQAFKW